MGYSYVFNPLAGAFDTVQDFQTVTAPDNAYIPPTGPVVFSDSFTEASNTLLNLHTPNVGTSWSLALSTGGATYTVNTAGSLGPTTTLNNFGCLYLANNASSSAAVEVGVTVPTVVSATNVVGVVFRYIDSNNFYLLTISSTAANTILWKKVAGVWSSLASSFNNINAGNTVKVRAVGSNIVVYIADIPVITRVDTSIANAGLCGISAGTIGQNATDDVSNAWRIDNFYVQNYASSGGNNTTGINVTGDVVASGQIVGHGVNSRIYPAFTFAGDTDTGFYRPSVDSFSAVTGGGVRATFFGSGLSVIGGVYLANGVASAPSLSFTADTNTGIYAPASDTVGISANGVLRWTVNSLGILAKPAASVPGLPSVDIASHGTVSNSGGGSGGFLVFNTQDYTETYLKADVFTYGGGLYSQGKLIFNTGYDYTLPYNSGVEFVIGATNYDAYVGNFTVSMQPCSGGNGGGIYLDAGGSSSIGVGGNVVINGGYSTDSSGGAITITGGSGPVAGNSTIEGGYSPLSSGGTLYLLGGSSAVGSGYGGTVYISGGSDGAGGFGAITIQPNPSAMVSIFGAGGSPQVTTAGPAATFVANTGTAVNTNSTFGGYTLAQVVQALRDYGWLA